jgi:hypothetical protein
VNFPSLKIEFRLPSGQSVTMNEKLLQFIWKFRYFEKSSLTTISGESVSIINPGRQNNNQGPDFLEARIKINNTIWIGNVELHLKTTDWNVHGHEL